MYHKVNIVTDWKIFQNISWAPLVQCLHIPWDHLWQRYLCSWTKKFNFLLIVGIIYHVTGTMGSWASKCDNCMMADFGVPWDTSVKVLLSISWTILNTTFLITLHTGAAEIGCSLACHHAIMVLDVIYRIKTAHKFESKLELGSISVVKAFEQDSIVVICTWFPFLFFLLWFIGRLGHYINKLAKLFIPIILSSDFFQTAKSFLSSSALIILRCLVRDTSTGGALVTFVLDCVFFDGESGGEFKDWSLILDKPGVDRHEPVNWNWSGIKLTWNKRKSLTRQWMSSSPYRIA